MSEELNVDQNKTDIAVSVGRGVLSQLPYFGPILSELFTSIIPNQRIGRVSKFAKMLNEKLEGMDQQLLEQRMLTEEYADLFEDGLFQAARALTDERKEYIASLLKNSISSDDLDHLQEKQLLSLLGELNDAELVILKSFGLDLDPNGQHNFFERHRETILGPQALMGSSQQEMDSTAIHETYRRHLRRLGLIRANYKKPKKNESPEWDLKTGMIKRLV